MGQSGPFFAAIMAYFFAAIDTLEATMRISVACTAGPLANRKMNPTVVAAIAAAIERILIVSSPFRHHAPRTPARAC